MTKEGYSVLSIRREDGFDFGSKEYHGLYERSSATLFQHPVWLEHLYGTLAPRVDAEPLVVTGRDARDGHLQLLLPMVRTQRRKVRRVGFADLGVTDYAIAVMDDDECSEHRGDVGAAIRAAIGDVDLVRVDKVPADPTGMSRLFQPSSARRHDYEAHLLTLGSSFEEWRADSYPRVARSLDKQRSKLERRGYPVALREARTAAEVDIAFEYLRAFRRARFAGRRAIDLMQDPPFFDFYREVARDSAPDGGPGSTMTLTAGDEVAAVTFNLADDERDLGLLLGYETQRYRRYSMGLMMVEEVIAASIGKGKRYLDMTIGHGGYKSEFGAQSSPMYSVRLPVTVRGRVAEAVANREAAARRTAKRAVAFQQRRFPGLDIERALGRMGRRGT